MSGVCQRLFLPQPFNEGVRGRECETKEISYIKAIQHPTHLPLPKLIKNAFFVRYKL